MSHLERIAATLLMLSCIHICIHAQSCQLPDTASLNRYRMQLSEFSDEFRTCELPQVSFFLFGMGDRTKLLYKDGKLINTLTHEIAGEWHVRTEFIIPNQYKVQIMTNKGRMVTIYEDEQGVFINEEGRNLRVEGTDNPVKLPDFRDYRYGEILKVLHQEILINIVGGQPVPNYFVYHNPWRRDAAMMAMCLEKTGNPGLIKEWVLALDDPYDRNNGSRNGSPETEADNLGQTLYLLSLFAGREHPLVKKILQEIPRYAVHDQHGSYIRWISDFHEAPVYQTKWLKYGLEALGLPDTFSVPGVQDNYSSLFWCGYKETYMQGTTDAFDEWKNDFYPYIGWAADHFHGLKRNPVSNRIYPLTWEIQASEADYTGMAIIDRQYMQGKIAVPHTWHAAEVFLYLIDQSSGLKTY